MREASVVMVTCGMEGANGVLMMTLGGLAHHGPGNYDSGQHMVCVASVDGEQLHLEATHGQGGGERERECVCGRPWYEVYDAGPQ